MFCALAVYTRIWTLGVVFRTFDYYIWTLGVVFRIYDYYIWTLGVVFRTFDCIIIGLLESCFILLTVLYLDFGSRVLYIVLYLDFGGRFSYF